MASFAHDLRFALRSLRRRPALTLAASLALAIAVGASTTVFSVVEGVLISPLPFADANRLVAVWQVEARSPETWRPVSASVYAEWRDHARSFDAISAASNSSATLTSFDDGETPFIRRVSHGYFELLGVSPAQGRAFRVEEDRPEGPPALILSWDLWQRRFGGDLEVLGTTTELDEVAFEIVGVMPEGFENPAFGNTDRPLAWRPLALASTGLDEQRANHFVVARLADGVRLAEARAEMAALSTQLATEHPDRDAETTALVAPLAERLVRDARPALLVLFGAVLCVLLIACANVANLLLVRSLERRKEIAVRRALGAGIGQVMRQLLAESLVLASIGGAGGVLLAAWGTQLVGLLIPVGFNIPRADFEIGPLVLVFALALALFTGLLFGLAPMLHALRTRLDEALAVGAARSTEGHAGGRLRGALVIAEVALSLMLLIGAGLMINTFDRLQGLDPGFDSDGALTFRVSARGPAYAAADDRIDFFHRVEEELATIPGVESVGATRALPFFDQFGRLPVTVDGQAPPEPGAEPRLAVRRVTPGYLGAMRIDIQQGRPLSIDDDAEAPPVVVISRSAAERLLGNAEPIGQRLNVLGESRQIVGVAQDTLGGTWPPERSPMVYLPVAQDADLPSMSYVLRTRGRPLDLVAASEETVRRIDRGVPLYLVNTLDQMLASTRWRPHFLRTLLSLFAVVACLLAGLGLYAVLAYAVSHRRREIGIRMALGAGRGSILTLVVRSGLLLAALGVGAGLAGALGLSRWLAGQLYGVSATDPRVYAVLSTAILALAVVASLVPAGRALGVEPVSALREE